MPQKLSDLLATLSGKAKQLEDKFATSKTETREKLQQWENDVKQKASENKAAFEEKKELLNDDVKSHWEAVKTNFDNGISKVKSDFRKAQYKIDSSNAALNAEWAEDNAEMSVYFALDAVADAEQAVIESIKARQDANSY